MAKPNTGNTRRLNFAAVKYTTFQVAKLLLQLKQDPLCKSWID
jgi:hypothetical protein